MSLKIAKKEVIVSFIVRRPSLKWNFHAGAITSMKVDLLRPARLFVYHLLLPSPTINRDRVFVWPLEFGDMERFRVFHVPIRISYIQWYEISYRNLNRTYLPFP